MSLNLRNAEKYCCEDVSLIENFEDAFVSEDKWVIHHRLETHTSDGERRLVELSMDELIALGMYYNRPASELIFMRRSDHMSLHKPGKHPSEETRRKMAEAAKRRKPISEETRRKMVEAQKKRRVREKCGE